MHKSPSLFFDILAEEDESKRNEKIQRASFEIKSHLVAVPPGSNSSTSTAAVAGHPCPPTSPAAAKLWSLQQQLLATVVSHDSAQGESATGHLQEATANNALSAESLHTTLDAHTAVGHQVQCQQQQQQLSQQQLSEQQQQHQQALVLTPQEVLQELLGDLFVHQDRLVMGELLGQGGFADVHQAELVDPLLGFRQQVAVKRLRPDVLKSPADLKEFLTEANLLRKLAHRNIVQLRGVGASDLSDLVAMRESMFVVQEYMSGGDLKSMVMEAMTRPFDPPYSKAHAFTWAMQVAEALHYLHCVCTPMVIHRDLKLDNVLLTDTRPEHSMAKLADFGLHKRVRRLVSSGTLVPWSQETTYHGIDYERSYYGGNMYLVKGTYSLAISCRDGDKSGHGSVGGSMHNASSVVQQLGAHSSGSTGLGLVLNGSSHSGRNGRNLSSGDEPTRVGGALGGLRRDNSSGNGGAGNHQQQQQPGKPPLHPGSSAATNATAAAVAQSDSSCIDVCEGDGQTCLNSPTTSTAHCTVAQGQGGLYSGAPVSPGQYVPMSDSAMSIQQEEGKVLVEQQQQQQELMSAVRAKHQGLLGKQEFVTRVLSAAARPELLGGPGAAGMVQRDEEVSRTFAAVQALEGSVRAGSAFMQQQLPAAPAGATATYAAEQQHSPSTIQQNGVAAARQQPRHTKQQHQQSELCPQLLKQLQDGLAAAKDSQKFIEATQKVGSLMYMAPEVLTGHQYNEKIDVFSFGIILYELLTGVVIAGRVAMNGEHEELLDYARQVANGHREALPSYWPQQVKSLISSCWHQDPVKRPGFKKILQQLYSMKQSGLDVEMEKLRPSGNYNPVTDCGCAIM